ncbi:MAG: hypothetical protein KIT50_00665 [Bacteroidetes bacterium]|nr:hypothetical protein [Bacteroidota bacterium]
MDWRVIRSDEVGTSTVPCANDDFDTDTLPRNNQNRIERHPALPDFRPFFAFQNLASGESQSGLLSKEMDNKKPSNINR